MHSLDRPRRALAAALAALAGYVDAVGFLSADRYFVSFMSGNTTRLATDAILYGGKAVVPALLIMGFVGGVTAGNVVANLSGMLRKPAVLLLVTLLLAIGATCAGTGQREAMMACLVLAMGALNNTLQRDETPVALTYLTGALVRIGQWLGGRLTGRARDPAWPFVLIWLALSGGAATGAVMFQTWGASSLWLGVVVAAALAMAAFRLVRVSRP